MSRKALVDQHQRDLAEDVSLSCHVQAPAGSGKTRLLVCRVLRLLAQVEDPREILALTFTKKAAGEMKERISTLLARARDGAAKKDDEDAHLLALARAANTRHPRRDLRSELQLMTFHAFCGQLVRTAPAHAGVALSVEVLEETDQKTLQQEVARELLRDILHGETTTELAEAASRRLLRLNNNVRGLEKQLANLIGSRELFAHLLAQVAAHAGDPQLLSDYVRTRVEGLVERQLRQAHAALSDTELGRHWADYYEHLASRTAEAAEIVGPALPDARWLQLERWQAIGNLLVTTGRKVRTQLGPKAGSYDKYSKTEWATRQKRIGDAARDALFELRHLPACSPTVTDARALLDLLRLGSEAIARYEALLATMNAMDFVAAEQRAMDVSAAMTELALERYLGHPITHLLVDEFQDTSRNQWELIRSLCHSWRDGDGRTVLLVGDPKQSIYGFRKAEVALFVGAKKGIPVGDDQTLPLSPVELSCNFRAAPALIGWANSLFAQLMANPRPEADEVAFQAARHPDGMGGAPAESARLALFAKPPPQRKKRTSRAKEPVAEDASADEGGTEAAEREARWLAAQVKAELDRDEPPESIGILLWTRGRRDYYLAALEALNIPVQVRDGSLVYDTHAGRHLVNLARALVRPHDDFAWAALLRAPWCWSPIARLVELSQLGPGSWRKRLERGGATDPAVAAIVGAMQEGWSRLGREPLATTVERIWLRLGGPMHVARRDREKGVQGCRMLLELMRAADVGLPQATLERIEQRLGSCYEPVDPRAARGEVAMMTVHAAKGLEFDVVFAPYLDRRVRSGSTDGPPPYLLERLPPPDNSYLMAVGHDQRREQGDPTYQLLERLHGKREEGEARRLCYVSYTRARKRLYLSGIVTANPERDTVKAGGTYLDWLLEAEGLTKLTEAQQAHTPGSGMALELEPELPELAVEAPAEAETADLTPTPVQAEQVPYRLVPPSKLAQQPLDSQGDFAWPDDGGVAVARGNVTHAALQRIAEGRAAPSVRQLERALRGEGLEEPAAERLAGEIAAEVAACSQDAFLGPLLQQPQRFRAAEYQVEAEHSEREILSGSMDLVVDDGQTWWVIDYKTSQLGEGTDVAQFAQRAGERYAGQLRAYGRMLIQARGLEAAKVKAGVYLTATRTWVEVPMEGS